MKVIITLFGIGILLVGYYIYLILSNVPFQEIEQSIPILCLISGYGLIVMTSIRLFFWKSEDKS